MRDRGRSSLTFSATANEGAEDTPPLTPPHKGAKGGKGDTGMSSRSKIIEVCARQPR